MIVCEYEFEKPDSKKSNYSLVEVDIYGWTLKDHWITRMPERLHYWRTLVSRRDIEVKRGKVVRPLCRSFGSFYNRKTFVFENGNDVSNKM